MKVLHALSTALLGGTEVSVLRMLPDLARSGIDGAVSIMQGGGPMLERFQELGITVHQIEAERGWPHAWRRFGEVLRRERPDVLHAYGFRMSVLARLRARRSHPRPLVVHGIRGLHLTDAEHPDGPQAVLARAVERALAREVDCYMANSESAVTFLSARGLRRGKFTVVPNGIDLATWTVGACDARVPRLVACVAGLRPVKRIGHLLDALAVLRARGSTFTCVIAGDGPLRGALERQAGRLGLGADVRFAGRIQPEQVRALLQECRVAVLPSSWEGMPVAVMEAMASAVPVVACAVPGVRDLVVHERTGLLVPPDDPAALAFAIRTLLDDKALACAFGAAGRHRIATNYTLEAQVAAQAAAYRGLLAGART